MRRATRTLFRFAALLILTACDAMHTVPSVQEAGEQSTTDVVEIHGMPEASLLPRMAPLSEFHDFGDRNFQKLILKMRALHDRTAPANTVLRIVQFGDSHTASDTITASLRQRFQQDSGDAGIGWIAPMGAPGQRHSQVGYKALGWKLKTSRQATDARKSSFAMGGYTATPVRRNARITIYPREESKVLWNVRLLVRQWKKRPLILRDARGNRVLIEAPRPLGLWRDVVIRAPLRLPLTITATSPGDADLGGLWLEKSGASGITVSPIGLNGVILKNWEHWSNTQWTQQLAATQADMVILAYGINEAIRPDLDIDETQNILRDAVKTIRTALPNSVTVIVGAPDALLAAAHAERCDERLLPRLREVKEVQQKIAKETQSLFWDWQAAMGGPCSMDSWFDNGLAKKDKVHFTPAGYQESAVIFYNDLMVLTGKGSEEPSPIK